jgi:hypothetical protein
MFFGCTVVSRFHTGVPRDVRPSTIPEDPPKAQKRVRAELVAAEASWWMARSARAALVALHRSGVEFRRPWKPPADLRPWEGPFTGAERRVPMYPAIAERQREYARRWRERKRVRELRTGAPSGLPTAAE